MKSRDLMEKNRFHLITALLFIFGWVGLLWMIGKTIDVYADPTVETLCCVASARDANGIIIRSSTVLIAWKKLHPCPSNGMTSGPCAGWIMDHRIPLACGGADAVDNLQWLPLDMWRAKSKWERKVYGGHNISKGCP